MIDNILSIVNHDLCNTYLIVDIQSVKNASSAGEKSYDMGKKVWDIKRHIVINTRGLPYAIEVNSTEFNERKGAARTIGGKPRTCQSPECAQGR